MSRLVRSGILALALLAFCSGSARADWWGHPWFSSSRYSYYPTYYYPTHYPTYYHSYYPVVTPTYYYVQPATYACPVPVVRPPVGNGAYSQPIPAPPSQTQEPPVFKKMDPPHVNESRSFALGDTSAAGVPTNGSVKEVCRVGFWNVSGRDVTLTVDGKAYTLPRDRSVTLSLNRTFRWQVDAKEAQADRLPDDTKTHEIVIR